MSEERWLPVVGYEGLYEVSDQGRIRRVAPSNNTFSGRILKTCTDTHNGTRVTLSKDGKMTSRSVRAIARDAFGRDVAAPAVLADVIEGEEWRDVIGFEGLYQVSDYGRVRTLTANGRFPIGTMIGSVKSTGYVEAALTNREGIKVYRRIHQLVLDAFVGPAPDCLECNHKNGVKTDNRLDNLEWITRSENHIHRARVLGLVATGENLARRGEINGSAKLTKAQVDEIREVYRDGRISQTSLAQRFGVHQTQISKIIRGGQWREA